MALGNLIQNWAQQNAKRYIYAPIPKARVDIPYDDTPLVADGSYLRVWLNEMFLARSREWFKEWYPAVQASVNLRFADQPAVTFSRVVRAPNEALARGVLMNYPLTELLPYRGGTVQIEAALLAFMGSDSIATSLRLLENVGKLVAAPLGQTLAIAQTVTAGIDELVGAVDGKVHLALHQTLVSTPSVANALRPGYIATINATEAQLDINQLSVKESRLLYKGQPLEGYDYFLLQIEKVTARDDWQLSYIDDLLDRTVQATIDGDAVKAETFRKALNFAVYQSDDLTYTDKRRVLALIKERLDFYTGASTEALSTAVTPQSLNELVNRPQAAIPPIVLRGIDEAASPPNADDLLNLL
ncbi:MAG: hypothetical protein ACOYL5_17705 [Phototrophicaceae bacterium]|jgi:hypothetical protein